VQAGIPDFRSTEGLFQTLKRDNPKEAMTSGKELFDASVFNVSSLFLRVQWFHQPFLLYALLFHSLKTRRLYFTK